MAGRLPFLEEMGGCQCRGVCACVCTCEHMDDITDSRLCAQEEKTRLEEAIARLQAGEGEGDSEEQVS